MPAVASLEAEMIAVAGVDDVEVTGLNVVGEFSAPAARATALSLDRSSA